MKILQLLLSQGGLGLPNSQLYYWAAVSVTVRWWFSQSRHNPTVTLEAPLLGSYAALSNLVYRAYPLVTVPMRMTMRVWTQARKVYHKEFTFSPHQLLWESPKLLHLFQLMDPQVWATRGIMTLKDIITNVRSAPFAVLSEKYTITVCILEMYSCVMLLKPTSQIHLPCNLIQWNV